MMEVQDLPTLSDILGSSSSSGISAPIVSSVDTTTYLAHLTALPLSDLEAEPTVLSSSSAQLTNALTTLCYTSYPTFLSLHSTTSTLSSSLTSLSSSLDALISSLPAFESSARSFAQDTREIQKDRQKAALVLEHHDKLYDVLSLPMLLDSCIRNHNYTEALLLANHATTLSQRFPTNPLILSVKTECDARVQSMLGQLLRMLTEQAKLPALFRTVGFLRKMEVLEEEELALAFLTSRGVYLEGVLKTVEIEKKGLDADKEHKKEAYARYLKRFVDLWREGVYDVVTQYTAIFLDRAPSTSASSPTQLHTLLTTFTTHHLRTLLALLEETLPLITDPSLLTPLLTQLTYCANSFARVGMDFKSLLTPIFVEAVCKGVTKEFDDAAGAWRQKLTQPVASSRNSRQTRSASVSDRKPSQLLVAPVSPHLPSCAELQALHSGPANVPPQILVSYPPLAVYTNAVLSTLNGLRLLAPAELLVDLQNTLEESLAKGGASLLSYAHNKPWTTDWKAGGNEGEEQKELEVLRAAGTVYVRVLVPFLRRALVEGVYGVVMSPDDMFTGMMLAEVVREWDAWLGGAELASVGER